MSYEQERKRPGRVPCRIMELYVPRCKLRFGITNEHGTCPAELGVDADAKCYQTMVSCPVQDSFDPEDEVFRWSTAQQQIPPSYRVRPTIVKIDDAPRRIAPARGLGEGAEAHVTLLDHPWSDIWEDPYRDERDYNPIEQGTYWPKWLARNPYYRGLRMRLLDGYISPDGFSLDDFISRELILDAVKGPDKDDHITLVGTDIFKLLEKDRSLVPAPSPGVLAAGISNVATSFTLSPTGVGNASYPAEFRCRIGKEGFDVTRSGDVCTITQRGLYQGAESHEEEDSVQVVFRQAAKRVDEIAAAMITTAQPILSSYIPTATWAQEAENYLPRLYSGEVTEPTGVNELLAELMDSVPVVFWPNERERRIEMRAIKPPPGTAPVFTDGEHFLDGTLDKLDRPKDRIDAAVIHFGILDPTGDRDKSSNYAQGVVLFADTKYNSFQIKEVYSRWISRFSKAHAQDLAESYIKRYRETPVTLKFHADPKHSQHWTGNVFIGNTNKAQSLTGANSLRAYQIIESYMVDDGQRHVIEYEAESYDWWLDEDDPSDERTIIFAANDFNIDMRDVYDGQYANVAPDVLFIIEGSVTIGSTT